MKTNFEMNKITAPGARMLAIAILCLVILVMVTSCASTKVTNREILVTGHIPRPGIIWVYNFAATADEVPANSALVGEVDLDTTPQTAGEIAAGMKVGHEMAVELVEKIRGMGMSAHVASLRDKPRINDIVIRGYLLSVKEGSGAMRVMVGFGAGTSSLSTMVEGFQVTSRGERKLGYGTVDATGNKSPGLVLGVATFLATKNPAGLIINGGMQAYGVTSGSGEVSARAQATADEIADALKKRFQEQGWIN
jgi:Domain of unknown function (DUF4410)